VIGARNFSFATRVDFVDWNLAAAIWGELNMACVEEYRQYAAELIRIAEQTLNSNDKAALLDMAQRWRELAEKLGREEGQRR
jgi:hypothetical protein